MASMFLQVRQAVCHLKVGSFYSLFFSVIIIFTTIFYIQFVSQLNLPLDTTSERNEDIIRDTTPGMIFMTRGLFKNNSGTIKVKTGNNVSESDYETHSNYSSSNVSASLIVQGILRSYTSNVENINKTNAKAEESSRHLEGSTSVNKSETMINLVHHGNESSANISVDKIPTNITDEISLKTSKTVAMENDLPHVNNIDASLISVNISKYDSSINSRYHERNLTIGRRKGIRSRNSKRPNYCPLWPPELVGPMQVEQMSKLTEIPKENLQLIKDGGKYRPPDCDPRERTAIIIPYRDREANLKILLRHLHVVLQRQKIEYGIFVVEMAFPTQFNRGLLANVGFLTASSSATYTCYIIHDVDLLVQDDRNMYRCGRVPRHLTASNTKFENKLPYLGYFGGVEAFTPDQFWKVNGFSNLYFGWGAEDDDMVYRIIATKQHFARPRQQIGGYLALDHGKDSTNPKNPNRKALLKSARTRMKEDGVRSVMYSRLALEFKPLYTWVFIAAKEAKYMEKYQQYLENG